MNRISSLLSGVFWNKESKLCPELGASNKNQLGSIPISVKSEKIAGSLIDPAAEHHPINNLKKPIKFGKEKTEQVFDYQVATDPVNDEPGLMVEVYLQNRGAQVAEIYCENGVVKADIYNTGNDAGASIDPRILQNSVNVAKGILQGIIDEDREQKQVVE